MPTEVLVALIGLAGVVAGAVATVLVARIQAAPKPAPAGPPETTPVLGDAIDIRELRILRSLFGEPHGRFLEVYKGDYYRPALSAAVEKGWVKKIEGRYYLTPKGADFCRAYLTQTLKAWQPAANLFAP